MKKKLLVVNKQNPGDTFYASPKRFGIWLGWGRRLSNYIFIFVEIEGEDYYNEILTFSNSDCMEIQKEINNIFNLS